tara:strand:+ start:1515 stop:2456 length:942 start_codon:yes stop_codon:yes gene_type:complete
MKKIIILLMSIGLITISSQLAASEKFTVLLDWFVNPDHGPLIVALERGEFSKRQLEVNLIAPADPNDPPKLVAAGRADIAVSYQPQLHLQINAGLPLSRIGTLIATPLNSIVFLASSPIKSIADLKGKKIGFSVGGFEDALLGTMLAKHGLSLNDVTLINVNFSLSPSLMSGQVDAVIGAFRNFELNQMDISGYPGRALFLEEEGIPPYDELILVAKNDRLEDKRLRYFIEAVEAGTQYIINHPEEAWKLFIKNHKDLDNELNKRAWRDTLPRFALRPGALDKNRYLRFSQFLKLNNLIETIPPVHTYAIEIP